MRQCARGLPWRMTIVQWNKWAALYVVMAGERYYIIEEASFPWQNGRTSPCSAWSPQPRTLSGLRLRDGLHCAVLCFPTFIVRRALMHKAISVLRHGAFSAIFVNVKTYRNKEWSVLTSCSLGKAPTFRKCTSLPTSGSKSKTSKKQVGSRRQGEFWRWGLCFSPKLWLLPNYTVL
jgi:hypothetical protein